jgi:hypothetical protein
MPGHVWRIESPLPPRECAARLKAAVPEAWTILSKHPVFGEVDSLGGVLQKGDVIDIRTSLRFSIQHDGQGSEITCRTEQSWLVYVFAAVIAVLLVAPMWGAFLTAIENGAMGSADLWGPFAVVGLCAAVPMVISAVSKARGAWLAAFIAQTVDGRIAP